MVFPSTANSVRKNVCPELAKDFEKADWAEVFNVTEFSRFGQWDEPALFPEIRYMLGWP